jgi:hypothetical protein
MSYDERYAAMDEMYERIGEELYPEHRVQAIGEFTAERLSSYYLCATATNGPCACEGLDRMAEGEMAGNSTSIVAPFCTSLRGEASSYSVWRESCLPFKNCRPNNCLHPLHSFLSRPK